MGFYCELELCGCMEVMKTAPDDAITICMCGIKSEISLNESLSGEMRYIQL